YVQLISTRKLRKTTICTLSCSSPKKITYRVPLLLKLFQGRLELLLSVCIQLDALDYAEIALAVAAAGVAEDQSLRHAVFTLGNHRGAYPIVGRGRLKQTLDVIQGPVGGR